jgi:hypothetical protein
MSMRIEGWAGVIGAITGVLALLVAGLTAYFTIFEQVDDLKVAFGKLPGATVKPNGDLWIIGPLEITFINSGNRSVAITNVWAMATPLKSPDATATNCDTPETHGAALRLDSFILKPGELELKKLEAVSNCFFCELEKGEDFLSQPTWVPKSVFKVKLGDAFLTCLSLAVATAEGTSTEIKKPVFKYEIGSEPTPLFDKTKPIVFVHNTAFVFWH